MLMGMTTSSNTTPLKIGVLGAGRMAEAVAGRWVAAGHDVLVGARRAESARAVADRIGAGSGSLSEAADFGDAALLAVSLSGVDDVLDAVGDGLRDKPLLDCVNALDASNFTLVGFDEGSLAEHIAARSGAHVIKAFNTANFQVWRDRPRYGGKQLAIPVAGDEIGMALATRLILDAGARPVVIGGMRQTGLIEAVAVVVIQQLFSGVHPTTTFQLSAADGAESDR
jgi:predicted dinucleotide-binding enzyme